MARNTRTRPHGLPVPPTDADPDSGSTCHRVEIERTAHKLLDPSLGRERAGFIAIDVWLWFTERRAKAPDFLSTPDEFTRGIRRKLFDEVRKHWREAAKYDDSTDVDALYVEGTGGGGGARMPTPDEVFAKSETIWHVQRAIAKLPPQMQRVIRLYDLDGWTAEEVALELGMTTASARLTRHRAKARLRELLASFGAINAA